MECSLLSKYLPAIEKLPKGEPLTKDQLMTEEFLISQDGDLDIYYAPHNEYINNDAKIVIVGITPGWSQMRIAFESFIKGLAAEKELNAILQETKKAASFAGGMRRNLISMLDQCGLYEALNIDGSDTLFERNRPLLHTTSVLKYPVFFRGNNYTGHQPDLLKTAMLAEYATEVFLEELAQINSHALIIPLGVTAERIIRHLYTAKQLSGHTILSGFPHPSGANGHRAKQFEQNQYAMTEKIRRWGEQL
ncbi:uracil-DNA glycosylase family protein [Cytobacillus firmus]|uniref:uracil-DNA glycosylase family protein n=1 Tax=Cytobacillus firmus TaxID=1399 RepID=UPI001C8EF89F|nr:uracil-DNA glycosylase family protein [Cytobacillus firmus]MBX9975038.1 hypothetical protein [Cytobacillus firmus]